MKAVLRAAVARLFDSPLIAYRIWSAAIVVLGIVVSLIAFFTVVRRENVVVRADFEIKAANQALQIDAYEETTYRRLMRYHACKGDKAAALSVYKTLVKLFSEFLGEEPGAATRHVHDDIMADRPVECIEGL